MSGISFWKNMDCICTMKDYLFVHMNAVFLVSLWSFMFPEDLWLSLCHLLHDYFLTLEKLTGWVECLKNISSGNPLHDLLKS